MPRRIIPAIREVFRLYFVTGLVVTVPVGGAVAIVLWLAVSVDSVLPAPLRPHVRGISIPGIGILAALVVTILIGVIARHFLGTHVLGWVESAMGRIPIFGGTYGIIKQVVEAVFSKGKDSFHRAVLIRFPHPGVWSIAFVTSSGLPQGMTHPERGGARPMLTVYVPTTPNPTGGYLLIVPEDEVVPMDMSVQEAFRMVMTMGIGRSRTGSGAHRLPIEPSPGS